ncbi:sigma-54-dependent transcriptional regulator [Brevibacillus brevis]|uniref:sigma-54-dependent transcriptional regulator n=1 Tax=Brevibacillus brevis TaxID=1393 RepID=UPI000D0F08E0|nr:sigma-54 dependent transcriptional regulator [Brevibacillus brevis]PSJ64576.1 sigma-54-dependent Fis family transcriptional regulator [Brevibacillus brevis]RED21451.1 two-component system NtrC family response regulator/two-component system response regulator AtoC [Brevibacillus brevis]GEC91790.1 sigma-54-dependent Fis family transcriptional regulator [Brevibacillus brevis]VEF87323.1 Nitrogen regulation protein NR(I) [Brevibacillus brevis]
MHTDTRILIVDDEADFRHLLTSRLKRKGYTTLEASDGISAQQLVTSETIHVILLDLKMPGMDGLSFLQWCKESSPAIQIIVVTGHGTIETAIEAMKRGAYDYLTKPYNLNELEVLISKAVEKQLLTEENQQLREALSINGKTTFQIVAESPKLKEVLATAKRVASTDFLVLLKGESGTGKDVIARLIYECSERASEAFVPINLGAIPETMLESELFGHEKGAFTGATAQKKGLVEIAHLGTLFLDEVGDLPFPLQVKLLRFLETGEFRRIGSPVLHKVDVRIIAATNADLEKKVEEGTFRSDLYFRLHVMDITIPPLSQRREDILPLSAFFLNRLKRKYPVKPLSENAQTALLAYSFPGNVRELAHMIERAVVLAKGEEIDAKDLFPHEQSVPHNRSDRKLISSADTGEEEVFLLKNVEREHIKHVLHVLQWNKTKTAEKLGISVRNLYRKIEEYELRP